MYLDLESGVEEIKARRKTAEELLHNSPEVYHKYARTLKRVQAIVWREEWRREMTSGLWYFGASEQLARTVLEQLDPERRYLWQSKRRIQDGYRGQEVVIFRNFCGGISYTDLIQMIDKWPYDVITKDYGRIPFVSKHVVIFSTRRPEDVFPMEKKEDGLSQLMRRIVLQSVSDDNAADLEISLMQKVLPTSPST